MTVPDLCATSANYSDLKLVKTRGVAQIILELPIDRAEAFIAAFGVPQPGKETMVAIALMQKEVMPHNRSSTGQDKTGATEPSASGQAAQDRPPYKEAPGNTAGGAPVCDYCGCKIAYTEKMVAGMGPGLWLHAACDLSRSLSELDDDARGKDGAGGTTEGAATKDLSKSERAKQLYRDSDAMEQARVKSILLCKDPRFQEWVGISDAQAVKEWMRRTLKVISRSEISTDERAFQAFLALETEYKIATGQMAEPR